jgi:MazG family protein
VKELLEIMARLRDRDRGCPWDVEQTFATIAPYTIEEAYEVADAIERGDLKGLEEELGDLLLQVVFHAQIAREQGAFDFERVAQGIAAKLVRRHPHVFGTERLAGAAAQAVRWEEIKAAEKAAAGRGGGLLDDVPLGLPALSRAQKLGRRAARIDFDWKDAAGARDKVAEELAELDAAIAGGAAGAVAHEVGDLLLAVANLARHLGVDAEGALRGANRRFESRFRHVEAEVAAGGGRSAAELDGYWRDAKARERGGG